MHMQIKRLSVLSAALLAGCSLTPTYERPAVPMPAEWAGPVASGGEAMNAQWWQRFGSAELDQLIDEALKANHDLAAAVTRIEQARASAIVARASLYPTADVGVSASRSRTELNGAHAYHDSDQPVVSMSYELDLWGGNAAERAAANARLAASQYDRDSVALVLQGDVAANYFQVLALRDRLVIARENLQAAQQLMDLVEVRFNGGVATALDVAQQRTTLLAIQAEIPSLEQSLRETLNSLAVLLGRAPSGFDVQGQSLSSLTLPALTAAPPVELLERRPDLGVAEARLVAANADIGAARAALYPGLTLSATGTAAGALTGGSTTVATATASLAQTLFAGGRLRGQVTLSEASRNELAQSYAQTVLGALREVENSLSAVATYELRAELVAATAEQSREAYRLGRVRYESGAEDLLNLLDIQRTRLNAEDSLVQAQLSQYTAAINLFKSLGGGWTSGT